MVVCHIFCTLLLKILDLLLARKHAVCSSLDLCTQMGRERGAGLSSLWVGGLRLWASEYSAMRAKPWEDTCKHACTNFSLWLSSVTSRENHQGVVPAHGDLPFALLSEVLVPPMNSHPCAARSLQQKAQTFEEKTLDSSKHVTFPSDREICVCMCVCWGGVGHAPHLQTSGVAKWLRHLPRKQRAWILDPPSPERWV